MAPISQSARLPLENPVLARELRGRARGARSYVIIGLYTGVVAVFVLIAYLQLGMHQSSTVTNQQAATVGRNIWMWGCFSQAILVPFIVPAFTCGAITRERELEMLEMLLLTRQTPIQICAGKLGSGVGLGLMLILASMPVLSLTFITGGVAPHEVFACLAVLMGSVIAAGSLGLAASAIAARTSAATTTSYLGVGLTMVGGPLLVYFNNQTKLIASSGSELGIVAMLISCLAFSFVPAVALGAACIRIGKLRTGRPAKRMDWILCGGLGWALFLAALYLPGGTDLLNSSSALMELHPIAVLLDVMSVESTRSPATGPLVFVRPGFLWIIWVGLALLFAAWCFQIAVMRVRALRMD